MEQVQIGPRAVRPRTKPPELLRTRDILLIPTLMCGLMVVLAIVTCMIADVQFGGLFGAYYGASVAITIVSTLVSLFWWTLQLARVRADEPLRKVLTRLRDRLPFLALPAVIFPLFLVAFTATKTAIPFIVGYSWDGVWSEADRALFGTDAWRIAEALLGVGSIAIWAWFYTVAWGLTLIFASALVALNARPSKLVTFYTALMASWLIGGVFMAYAMSAAGPVFVHLFDPRLAQEFDPLQHFLQTNLAPDASIRTTQLYLAGAVGSHVAVKGGGISAMPSMHLGTATIYVLASWRTRWLLAALAFWIIIFVCSAYFGYHYWVDGIVAAAVAALCWKAAELYVEARTSERFGAGDR